jgi:hypothetical protein
VILVFDTGQHRHLTLSQADGYVAMMQWGRAQPETVRDYALAVRVNAQWQQFVTVTGNYQRQRRHQLSSVPMTDSLRVIVNGTNGIDHARLFEVRAYA